MTKFIRISIPVRQPDGTIKLCRKIIEKDTDDGVDSYLQGYVDMTAFLASVNSADDKRKDADKKDRLAQKKYQQLETKCGVEKDQRKGTKNTILWFVRQTKKVLLLVHDGEEEALSEYGFNVVISSTGARKNVRVDIPKTPEKILELAEAIIEYHTELGVDSPLTDELNMTAFSTLVTDGRELFHDWDVLRGQVQSLNNQALVTLGYAADQTSGSEGTIYHNLLKIRDRLLQKCDGEEEAISEWGFDVVISSKSVGRKTSSDTIVIITVTVPMGQSGNVDFSDLEGNGPPPTMIDFESAGSNGDFFAAATLDGVPGTGPVLPVADGGKVSRSPEQVSSQLGLGDDKPYLKVQNSGLAEGTYKVTFHLPPDTE